MLFRNQPTHDVYRICAEMRCTVFIPAPTLVARGWDLAKMLMVFTQAVMLFSFKLLWTLIPSRRSHLTGFCWCSRWKDTSARSMVIRGMEDLHSQKSNHKYH